MSTEIKRGVMVRVQSDGTPFNERVVDAATGELIEHVRQASISMVPGEVPQVELTIMLPQMDVVGRVVLVERECPYCGHSEVEGDE